MMICGWMTVVRCEPALFSTILTLFCFSPPEAVSPFQLPLVHLTELHGWVISFFYLLPA